MSTTASIPFLAATFAVLVFAHPNEAAPLPGSRAAGAVADTAAPRKAPEVTRVVRDSAGRISTRPDTVKSAAPAPAAKAAPDSAKRMPADSAKAAASADSAKRAAAVSDSAKGAVAGAADTLKARGDSAAADTASGKAKKRKRIVRETTVNTIDELKGRYRSPKKALFMSLVLPGLGQAYVGQHWTNYARGAIYFLTDVALVSGWHYYVVTKQNREIAHYQKFADQHWRQGAYEDSIGKHIAVNPLNQDQFDALNPHRQSYCQYVQETGTAQGKAFYKACLDPLTESGYGAFANYYNDRIWGADSLSNVDSISARRAQFVNPQGFYELLGKETEFITGWDDANDNGGIFLQGDTAYVQLVNGKPVDPTTAHQQDYVTMRNQANEYARMQAYFLGGLVLNHIVSALDAALAAHFHNLSLYQTEVRWWERLRLDSRIAWNGRQPAPTVTAALDF